MKLAALLLLVPSLAFGSSSMEDAFSAYVKIRQAQEETASSQDPIRKHELDAALTNARIEFHSVGRSDQKELSTWEKLVLARVDKKNPAPRSVDPDAISFLGKAFPNARDLSPLEWKLIGEWFGQKTQQEFLDQSFAIRELPASAISASAARLVWIVDPYRKLLPHKNTLEKADLEKISADVTVVNVSAFAKIEYQAEELRHSLLTLGDEPFVIVSEGEASALLLKMFDLYPAMRKLENVQGWINVNGRLYGSVQEPKKSRGLASVSAAAANESRAEQFSADALEDLKQLRLETLERPMPLGKGFPIVNVFSQESPRENLRESLIAEGTSFYVNGSVPKRLPAAFPLLVVGAAAKP